MRPPALPLSVCRVLIAGLALFITAGTALGFDVWGDNGSQGVGGGNNGGPGGGGPGPDGGPGDGEPVAIYSGQYTLTAIDAEIPGRMPLRVKRFYRSGSNYQGMFGRGWNIEYNERIFVLATNGNLLLRRNDITKDEFTNLGTNTYSSPNGVFDRLVRNQDGTYTLRDKNGGIRQYDAAGRLTEVRDRNGNQLLLTYDPSGKQPINVISDYSHFTNAIVIGRDYRLIRIEVAYNSIPTGRYLQFAYDGNGRVTNITDFVGRSWKYAYDAGGFGTLTSVTTPPASGFPSGLSTLYTYNSTNHLIQGVTDQSGNALLQNAYDSQGRVVQQTWGTAVYRFAYPNATDRWMTNASGYRTYRLFDANGLLLERRDYTAGLRPTDPAFYSTKYIYTNVTEPGKVINPGGNVVVTRYDSSGNAYESRRKAADVADSPQDVVARATYDPIYNQVKTFTDPRGYATTNVYDYEMSGLGTNGNLVRMIFPATSAGIPVLSWTYNVYGQIDYFTNQVGAVTRYIYDTNGYVVQRIDGYGTAQAATNLFTVDLRGNILTSTDGRGNTTTYQYDNLDRRTQTTQPGPLSFLTAYAYTGNGKTASVAMQTGDGTHPWQTNSFTYDLLDRPSTLVDGAVHITQLAYDAIGNQTNSVDANSNSVGNLYDERKLLWKVISAQTNVTRYGYNLNGKLAWTADAKSNVVAYAYDAYDRLTNITYPDATFEGFLFDPNGNIVSQRSRAGLWVTNVYDSANKLVQRVRPDASVVTYQYDLAGRQLVMSDSGGTASSVYDILNRVTVVTNTFGKRLAYEYDRANNRTRLIDPEGVTTDYGYDSLNRVTNIVYAGSNLVASFTYDALSRQVQTDFGNGIRGTQAYDWANLPTNLTYLVTNSGTILTRQAHTYDNVGNRLSIQGTGGVYPGLHAYSYDPRYQITAASYPPAYPFPNSTYAYDAMGNRTTVNEGSSTGYSINNLNQYTTVGAQTLSHNANASLTAEGTAAYTYDNDDRMLTASRSGNSASYAYDPWGVRAQKTVNGVARNFLYDLSGPIPILLGEYDGSGNPLVKYVFNAVTPVAMVAGASVYSCHCDYLSRPILMTDRTGALVWQANYAAFGQAALVATNTADINLRAAGQYEDTETGLFYNMSRYYNPRIGRYQSFDPAMEASSPLFAQVQGANAYAYVGNNAVNAADPNGNISIFFIICSGPLPVCSLSLICSGQAIIGACSVGLICSGQAGIASACSASVVACSAQGGAYGASACSGNVVGVCSAQGSYVGGVGACSGQIAGACSAQAGPVGASACSANGAGACSGQLGAGASACSAQGAGACSVQVGPGASACSAQGAGACSAQPDMPGPFGCSAQGAGACSASTASGCKHASNWRNSPEEGGPLLAAFPGLERKYVTGLSVERTDSGQVAMRFIAHGYARFQALAAQPGSKEWFPVAGGRVGKNQVTQFRTAGIGGSGPMLLKLRLEGRSGKAEELGPFTVQAPTGLTQTGKPGRSPWLAAIFVLSLPSLLWGSMWRKP
jgi:RHS repeat-associated protein